MRPLVQSVVNDLDNYLLTLIPGDQQRLGNSTIHTVGDGGCLQMCIGAIGVENVTRDRLNDILGHCNILNSVVI